MSRQFQLGDVAEIRRVFEPVDIDEYAALAGHKPAGRAVPEPLIGALFSYLLGMKLPGMGTNYLKQESTFHTTASVGQSLIASVVVTGLRPEKHLVDLRTSCRTADGELVCDGRALVYVKDVCG